MGEAGPHSRASWLPLPVRLGMGLAALEGWLDTLCRLPSSAACSASIWCDSSCRGRPADASA